MRILIRIKLVADSKNTIPRRLEHLRWPLQPCALFKDTLAGRGTLSQFTVAKPKHLAHVVYAASGPLGLATLYDMLTSGQIDLVMPRQV